MTDFETCTFNVNQKRNNDEIWCPMPAVIHSTDSCINGIHVFQRAPGPCKVALTPRGHLVWCFGLFHLPHLVLKGSRGFKSPNPSKPSTGVSDKNNGKPPPGVHNRPRGGKEGKKRGVGGPRLCKDAAVRLDDLGRSVPSLWLFPAAARQKIPKSKPMCQHRDLGSKHADCLFDVPLNTRKKDVDPAKRKYK